MRGRWRGSVIGRESLTNREDPEFRKLDFLPGKWRFFTEKLSFFRRIVRFLADILYDISQ